MTNTLCFRGGSIYQKISLIYRYPDIGIVLALADICFFSICRYGIGDK